MFVDMFSCDWHQNKWRSKGENFRITGKWTDDARFQNEFLILRKDVLHLPGFGFLCFKEYFISVKICHFGLLPFMFWAIFNVSESCGPWWPQLGLTNRHWGIQKGILPVVVNCHLVRGKRVFWNTQYCSSVMLGFNFSSSRTDVSNFSFPLQLIWCWWKVLAWPPLGIELCVSPQQRGKGSWLQAALLIRFQWWKRKQEFTQNLAQPPETARFVYVPSSACYSHCLGELSRRFSIWLTSSLPWSHWEIWLLAPAPGVPLSSLCLCLCSPAPGRSLYNMIMQPCKWTWFSLTANPASGLPLWKSNRWWETRFRR